MGEAPPGVRGACLDARHGGVECKGLGGFAFELVHTEDSLKASRGCFQCPERHALKLKLSGIGDFFAPLGDCTGGNAYVLS